MATTPENRQVLRHVLNISNPYSFETPKFVLINDGVTELSEELNVDTDSVHYVNEKNATTTVKSYAPSISLTSFYLDEKTPGLNKWMRDIIYNQPTGAGAQTDYIRFNILDTVAGQDKTYEAVRFSAVISASSIGGAGGDNPTMEVAIGAVGDPIKGTLTIDETTTPISYIWNAGDKTSHKVSFTYTGTDPGKSVTIKYGNYISTSTTSPITFTVPDGFEELYKATSEGKADIFGEVGKVTSDATKTITFA